ncbi:hypothetical protein M231_01274 [Tremella mesenterica]|uniref:Uncharacterized protein n=1 Tax=Tremella mesenterica TaxID=5217 RepID=A0A4Q1BTG7_TREME|nr:hypothetical protein M231_01274 [Tremella mesenterica]
MADPIPIIDPDTWTATSSPDDQDNTKKWMNTGASTPPPEPKYTSATKRRRVDADAATIQLGTNTTCSDTDHRSTAVPAVPTKITTESPGMIEVPPTNSKPKFFITKFENQVTQCEDALGIIMSMSESDTASTVLAQMYTHLETVQTLIQAAWATQIVFVPDEQTLSQGFQYNLKALTVGMDSFINREDKTITHVEELNSVLTNFEGHNAWFQEIKDAVTAQTQGPQSVPGTVKAKVG